MGTDIHGVFQRHDAATNTWHDIESKYEQDRYYQLFAVLAGVRNGYGFAGVTTGEPVKPISKPRGYPADFALVETEEDSEGKCKITGPAAPGTSDAHPIDSLDYMTAWRRKYRDADDALYIWMGDHSHSWLNSTEMLAWWAEAPTVVKTGIVDRKTYEAWDKQGTPPSYCGGVSGPGVVIVNDDQMSMQSMANWTYVRCHWESKLADELAYFFDEVKRLHDEHGLVRFVFGFDS